jgi:hypothetical protein
MTVVTRATRTSTRRSREREGEGPRRAERAARTREETLDSRAACARRRRRINPLNASDRSTAGPTHWIGADLRMELAAHPREDLSHRRTAGTVAGPIYSTGLVGKGLGGRRGLRHPTTHHRMRLMRRPERPGRDRPIASGPRRHDRRENRREISRVHRLGDTSGRRTWPVGRVPGRTVLRTAPGRHGRHPYARPAR